MQVTDKTKFADFEAFNRVIDQSSKEDLKRAAERKYGSPWALTLGTMFACMDGDFSHIGIDVEKPMSFLVLQFYWIDAFRDMCEALTKALERMTVPASAEAKKANASCLPMTFKESVLVFCREYFGLHSFNDVYALTIDDYLLAKKDAYNKGIFDKTMADIHKQKIAKK